MIDIETIRKYCLKKPFVLECFPFDDETLVYKVHNKMFALMGLDNFPLGINLKCDPEYAIELREKYDAIKPGWHMNKKHWNTLTIEGSIPDKLVFELIDHSYNMVYSKLPSKLKQNSI